MGARDPRIDAYIAKAQPFARPILKRIRKALHAGCPGVVEDLKWGAPAFMYDGRILAMMAAFREHCRFGFWYDAGAIGKTAPELEVPHSYLSAFIGSTCEARWAGSSPAPSATSVSSAAETPRTPGS